MLEDYVLDTEDFQEIMEEAKNMAVGLYPDWTDFNYHDPGITMLELFAWIKEGQQYYLDQIGTAQKEKYLKLLGVSRNKRKAAKASVTIKPQADITLLKGTKLRAGSVLFETVHRQRLIDNRIIECFHAGSNIEHDGIGVDGRNIAHDCIGMDGSKIEHDCIGMDDSKIAHDCIGVDGSKIAHDGIGVDGSKIAHDCIGMDGSKIEHDCIAVNGRDMSVHQIEENANLRLPIFGEDPKPGDTWYIGLEKGLPVREMVSMDIRFASFHGRRRNPLNGPLYAPMLKLSYEYYAAGGWHAVEWIKDDTYGMLQDGLLYLNVQRQMEPVNVSGRTAYYIRIGILESDIDLPPVLEEIHWNELPVIQKDTWVECEMRTAKKQGESYTVIIDTALGAAGDHALYLKKGGLYDPVISVEKMVGEQECIISFCVPQRLSVLESQTEGQIEGRILAHRKAQIENQINTQTEIHAEIHPEEIQPEDVQTKEIQIEVLIISSINDLLRMKHGYPQAQHSPGIGNGQTKVPKCLGIGNGQPWQEYELPSKQVLYESVELLVHEIGTVNAYAKWERVADFGASGCYDKHFTVDTENGSVCFGDCEHGMAPEGEILLISFAATAGEEGNVKKGMISQFHQALPVQAQVLNRQDAYGGREEETIEECFLRARRALKTPDTAVTNADYERLIQKTPGLAVAGCKAIAEDGMRENTLAIVVKAEGKKLLPRAYRKNILAYLEPYRMLGTRIQILAPLSIQLELFLELAAKPHYRDAKRRIKRAVEQYFDQLSRQFGAVVSYSEIYGMLDTLACVAAVRSITLDVRDGKVERTADGSLLLPPNGVAQLGQAHYRLT